MEFQLFKFDARFFSGLLVFHPEENYIYGASNNFMQDSGSGYRFSPRSELSYIWQYLCWGVIEFYLAFGIT